jgi:hypothetical protein
LARVGAATTVTLAFDVLPVPPLVDATCTLLFFTPAVVPETFTPMAQEAPGARVAPNKLTDEDPLAAVVVPLQLLVRLAGVATTSPAGRLSVYATPLSVEFVLALLTVNVRLVVPFKGTVEAPNVLVIAGGAITVRVAEAVFPLPASEESMVTLLLNTPSMALCTFTVIVQVPVARAAVVKLIVPAPAIAVTVPPPTLHPLATAGVVATTKLAGKESVKFELIVTEFPLVMPNVTVLGALTATVVGLKLLAIEGGCKMVIVAVTVC